MLDVIFYEAFKEEEQVIKTKLDPEIKALFTSKTIQESGDQSPNAKLISIRTQSHIPESWSSDLDGILTRSQGFDHLENYKQTTQTKAKLGYLGSYCSRAVAEHGVMVMLALLKNLSKQQEQFESFNRDNLTGHECKGKNALVLGVGSIGSELVNLLKGMQLNVKGFDKEERIVDLEYVDLTEGLGWADIIFCALPLTKETNGFLNIENFYIAKEGVLFINLSRCEISPTQDLYDLMTSGIVVGLGLDVYEKEGLLAEALRTGRATEEKCHQQLLELNEKHNVILTPHNAFNSYESLNQKAELSARSIEVFLETGQFPTHLLDE